MTSRRSFIKGFFGVATTAAIGVSVLPEKVQTKPEPSPAPPSVPAKESELFESSYRVSQQGVTLAAGQGVILAGATLMRKGSMFYIYDGSEPASGILRRSVDTGSSNTQANMVTSGTLKSHLVTGLDDKAARDLGAHRAGTAVIIS